MRGVGKGDDDDDAGSFVCWKRTTLSVAVCDADRPSISTVCSIELMVDFWRRVTCRPAPPAIDELGPLQNPMYSCWLQ